jgi:hypothetical protein
MTTAAPGEIRPIGWTGPTGATVTAHLRFVAATDNRKGRGQTIVTGLMEEIHWPPRDDGFVGVELRIISGLDLFKDGHAARFLIDGGSPLALYYVATWGPDDRAIGLKHETRSTLFDPEISGPKRLYTLHVTGRTDTP